MVHLHKQSIQSYSGPLEMQLMTCPDDCVSGIIEMIDAADSTIELSLQYLDLDYWDSVIIQSLKHSTCCPKRTNSLTTEWFYADR